MAIFWTFLQFWRSFQRKGKINKILFLKNSANGKNSQKKNIYLHWFFFFGVVTMRKFTSRKKKHKYKIEIYKYIDPSKYNNFSQCFMASENTRSPWQSIPHQWPPCLPLANSPAIDCRLPWNWFSSFHCMVPLLPTFHSPLWKWMWPFHNPATDHHHHQQKLEMWSKGLQRIQIFVHL